MPETLLKTVINFRTVLPSLFLFIGCDSFKPVESCDFADSKVEGYTQTNIQAQVLNTDKDDWRESPTWSLYASVEPAFPNPTGREVIYLRITINDLLGGALSNVDIIAQTTEGQWVSVLDLTGRIKSTPDVGLWELPVRLTNLSQDGTLAKIAGLHRLYVVDQPLAIDFCSSLISYGDVLILP